LIHGKAKGENWFLIFWLVGWTVGGIFAMVTLFRLLRRSIPESLLLERPNLIFDTGVAPFVMAFDYRSSMDAWKRMFKKREHVEFTPDEISTLRLREFDSGNRLTIDKGSNRYDLGVGLSETEREWLYQVLCEEYKLAE